MGAIGRDRVGERVILGFRPEHIKVTADGAPVDVLVVEPMGSETQVVTRSGDTEIVCLFRERMVPQPGDVLRIAPDPNLVHLFDAGTSKRLN